MCYKCLCDLALSDHDYTAKESRETECRRGRDIPEQDEERFGSSVIYDQLKGGGGENFAMNDNVSYSVVLN